MTIRKTTTLAMAALTIVAMEMPAAELDLSGTWHLVKADDAKISCPIAVPGGVHSALLKAKLIKDSFWGRNERNNLWVGKSNWIVSRKFEVNGDFLAKKEIVLRLEDCDTFAKVSVNGAVVGSTTDKPAFWTWMDARGICGEFDDNAVTLVPGRPRTFVFTLYDKTTTPQAFKAAFSVTHLAELCK